MGSCPTPDLVRRDSRWSHFLSRVPRRVDLRWLPVAALAALTAGTLSRENALWAGALFTTSLALLCWAALAWSHRCLAVGALLALALCGWRAALEPRGELPLGERLLLRGQVAEDPRQSEAGPRVIVDLDEAALPTGISWRPVRGRVLLQVRGEPDPPVGRGDRIFLRSSLSPAYGFRNPGTEGYRRHLARKGISARATARWPGEILSASPGTGTPVGLRTRRRTTGALAAAVPGQAGAVLRSLALGDRSGLSPGTMELFRRTGTAHLLAISGFHLGVLALLLVPLFRSVLACSPILPRMHPVEPFARAAVLPVLVVYASLSGFQVSTVRALTLVGLLILGTALSRAPSPPLLLVGTLLTLALPNPIALSDPALHLSAAALVGLFWLAPKFERVLSRPPNPLDAVKPRTLPERVTCRGLAVLRTAGCASLATTLTTTPIAAFHFGTGSLLGLVANPVAVPLTGFLILPFSLAGTLLFHLCPWLAEPLWSSAGVLVRGLLALLGTLARHPFDLGGPLLSTPWSLLGCACLFAALGRLLEPVPGRKRTLLLLFLGSGLVVLPPLVGRVLDSWDPRAHVWVFDVGQGQAVGVRLPGARWGLVDAGGFSGSTFDVGERVVIPALERLGARRLWLLASSHPHPDHLGGMTAALRWGRAERLWLPASFRGDPRYEELLAEAHQLGTAVRWVGPEGVEERGERYRVLGLSDSEGSENDRSLVLRIEAAERSVLLPGDLEIPGQHRLLESGFPLPCDLLIAPHHASSDALLPPFLKAVDPKFVVVSASGRGRLPSPAFEAAVENLGSNFLSTHRVGCVHAIAIEEGFAVDTPFH